MQLRHVQQGRASIAKRALARLPRGDAVLPLLLITLSVLMFVAWPLADIGVLQRPLVGMLLLIVVLCGLLALGGTGRFAPAIIPLGILLLILQSATLIQPSENLNRYTDAIASVFLLLLCVVLLLGVFGPGRITAHRIMGAVTVYLLVALFFSLLFDLTERLAPDAFTVGSAEARGPAPPGARFFYLSVITLTSVGFGDMAPLHPIARALVMVEAILGQIYTTVLLAWLVSLEVAHRQRNGP